MWWLLIPSGIILILIYVIFAPFFIEIDTEEDRYGIRFHRLAKVNFFLRDKCLFANVSIAWWDKEINISETMTENRRSEKGPSEKRKAIAFGKFYPKAKGVLSTFRVRKMYIMIDTGNMPLNGKLYPCFYYLSCISDKTILINFRGENTVIIKIQNSLGKILWAFIRS